MKTKDTKKIPALDDIVFEGRNTKYGAYVLRKNYFRNVTLSVLIASTITAIGVIAPYMKAKATETDTERTERQVVIKMAHLDQPAEMVAPPPPPPPKANVMQQAKYVPPVVVDSVKPEDAVKLMTADEAQSVVKNENIEIKPQAREVAQETETKQQPFVDVEEMPVPAGGEEGLLKFLANNTKYPEVAKENNIQGRVVVRFCVTPTGGIDRVSVIKGVDPELDAEAVRVVKLLPKFTPGKQEGVPVPVWYMVPIQFSLQ